MSKPLYDNLLAHLQRRAPSFEQATLEAALQAVGAEGDEADAATLLTALADLYTAERERTRQLTRLYKLTRSIGISLELDEVLQEICTAAAHLLGAPQATIFIIDHEAGVLAARTAYGLPPSALSILNFKVGEGVTGGVAANGLAKLVADTHTEPLVLRRIADPLHARSMAVVPISLRGLLLGVLNVASDRPANFSEEDVHLLELLTHQAGQAIENAQLHHQARELAAQEERQRLARDLHDSVTQSLFAINLISQVIPSIWQSHPEQAATALDQMATLSSDALSEMRALLFQLRPIGVDEVGLEDALRRYVDALQGRGYNIQFVISSQLAAEQQLPPPLQEAIYRVAQEATNNATRHAHASQIAISLNLDPQRVSLMVHDDGIGFSQDERARPGHLGIGNMYERAAQVGGQLYVVSVPGEGTAVRLEVPLGLGQD